MVFSNSQNRLRISIILLLVTSFFLIINIYGQESDIANDTPTENIANGGNESNESDQD